MKLAGGKLVLAIYFTLAVMPLCLGCTGSDSGSVASEPAANAPRQTDADEKDDPTAALSAEEILASIEDKVAQIEDYHYISKSIDRLGDETDPKVLDIWFKRPRMFRSTVVEGANEGGAVTLNRDGVIHGKTGGILGFIVLTLKEDDDRIRGLRGRRFFETSWEQEVREIKTAVEDGWELARHDDQRVDGSDCRVLVVTGTRDGSAVTQEQIWVDRDSYLIKRRQAYEGDSLVRDVIYTQIEINLGTADEHFSLK